MILVTGGSGFIGSNFIHYWFNKNNQDHLLNIDLLTYASNQENLRKFESSELYFFEKGSLNDEKFLERILRKYQPEAIINFAAESHVDNSIESPKSFIDTNVVGTFNLLESSRKYFLNLDKSQKARFRLIHVSTDEVYGSLTTEDKPFTENNQYKPNSPYSASKAASDHLVRAYFKTFKLPCITTNCSNNFGPYQFPEKLIPLSIKNALLGNKINIYGDGLNIRDWLYVEDHCDAIFSVLNDGIIGETYNIGGKNELTNIQLVKRICEYLDYKVPKKVGSFADQIEFISDRPGHDKRYAINSAKIESHLGWKPKHSFDEAIVKTIDWYIYNKDDFLLK